jgi:hypothetical protein
MLASLRFADPEFRVLTTLPMDRQHDIANSIVDIDNNVGDQCTKQLLTGAHRYVGRIPRCL